jgi:hypothetical protein
MAARRTFVETVHRLPFTVHRFFFAQWHLGATSILTETENDKP